MASIIKIINRGFRFLLNPKYRKNILYSLGIYDNKPDEYVLQMLFKLRMGYELDLNNPKTFNEKLQWLKLNFRKPEMSIMADKHLARKFVADKIGSEYLIPLLGVWNDAKEIDFNTLPNQFVIKCNHNSGLGMCICKDKSKLNTEKVRKDLQKGLNQNYYLTCREWPYKDISRKIVAEQFIIDHTDNNESLRDYKFFCFNGKVEFFKIDLDRFTDHHANYYDRNGQLMNFGEIDFPPIPNRQVSIPPTLGKMIELAEKLANGYPFLRVDFYSVDNKIYFGELTFYPSAGFGKFTSHAWDKRLGDMINLNYPNNI